MPESEPTDAEALARDVAVIAAATPGPWTVHNVDDRLFMNAWTVVRPGGTGELDDHENNVAIVLLQDPQYADVGDGRWDENAEFIARARTRWPEAVERSIALEQQVDSLRRKYADLRRKMSGK